MSVRTVSNWLDVFNGKTLRERAEFILSDLTHYPMQRRAWYDDDVLTLTNALAAMTLTVNTK